MFWNGWLQIYNVEFSKGAFPLFFIPLNHNINFYNQWQNIGILKSVFKIPLIQFCEPIKFLHTSFAHCSSTLLRGGKGETLKGKNDHIV